MLPSPERFAKFAGAHGILSSSHVMVYDCEGVFSAPRTVFTFKYDEIVRVANGESRQVLIDARPLEACVAGHIPTSLSLGFPQLLLQDPAGFSRLPSPADLKAHLEQTLGADTAAAIVEGKVQVINTCGGGLSASINWLALQSLGVDSRLYDESWNGYSARPHSVLATGPTAAGSA
ncbi:hypothetical protein RQP46_001773 [Phenoliferia psychrophenolica]